MMAYTAKARVFMNGRSQHVTIPAEFRFRATQVTIRRDKETGDLILSENPELDDIFAALDAAQLANDFLLGSDRDRTIAEDRPGFLGDESARIK